MSDTSKSNISKSPMLGDTPCETGTAHTHVDKNGFLVDCYHSTKNVILSGSFWLGVTLSFPLEHFLWEKVWPFSAITAWMGL